MTTEFISDFGLPAGRLLWNEIGWVALFSCCKSLQRALPVDVLYGNSWPISILSLIARFIDIGRQYQRKSASEPARRARASLAAMLDPGLLKENIDGEALLWASRRLLMRPEKRRILIVISDGAPVDQLTLEINTDKQILDRHLRQVIAGIQSSGAIELTAIGVKYDTCQYYPNGVRINEVENLGPGLIGMVDELLLSR